MVKNNIKVLAFDVGGVLMLGNDIVTKIPKNGGKSSPNYRVEGVHESMAHALNVSIDHWFDAIDSSYANSIIGKNTKAELLRTVADNLGISPKLLEKKWKKVIKKNFVKNNKLLRAIKLYRKLGLITVIISDQFDISDEVLIKDSKIEKFFDLVVVSNRIGMRKPDKKIFVYTIKKLRVKPSEVLFVDNREWNTIPASKLGMKTILFKDNDSTIKKINSLLMINGGRK